MNPSSESVTQPAAASRPDAELAAAAPASEKPAASRGAVRRKFWLSLLVVLLLALVWQVFDLRQRVAATQAELARRLADEDVQRGDLKAQIRQTQELAQSVQHKLTVFETRVGDVQAQQAVMEGAFHDLTRSRDAWLLAEVEHMLNLAAQQLQITGNVSAAVAVLDHAAGRLARSQQPQFAPLRQAIGQDLQRLRGIQSADLASISLALENIAMSVESMGLAFEARPVPGPAKSGPASKSAVAEKSGESIGAEAFWQRWLRETWGELRALVHIERSDRADPGLLVPSQAFFLRENLKLRLLSARVELQLRDQAAFRAEVRQALHWMERYFDARDRRVHGAVESLKPLLSNDFNIAPPSLSGSLSAVRAVKLPAERLAR